MNKFGKVKSLFELLYQPEEIYQVPGSAEKEIDYKHKLKETPLKMMNDYLNPLFQGMDPDEDIEEEYKKKNDPCFCWKFLRAASFFEYREGAKAKLTTIGNVEKVAQFIHKQAEKRPINMREKKAEEVEQAAATAPIVEAEADPKVEETAADVVEKEMTVENGAKENGQEK